MGIKSPKFLRSQGSRRTNVHRERTFHNTNPKIFYSVASNPSKNMATFELYRRSTIGMCLTETLDEMVQNGTLSPELAIQVLVQFDKSMTEALKPK
ncbi:transcription initiation factor IIA subunit 2-like [Prunus yedoensis var. nudiflora]|uniref:Transcription initiation factor IIA subunit 2-like n=1 Tax=Prunus yedoensis var. nudiflora TaxID=2094558 RepID=A0A314Y6U6_PRUYE|nr:transcription initiation factor IIA subunit 2-like [Prunus yedoensis var. nudiflora]